MSSSSSSAAAAALLLPAAARTQRLLLLRRGPSPAADVASLRSCFRLLSRTTTTTSTSRAQQQLRRRLYHCCSRRHHQHQHQLPAAIGTAVLSSLCGNAAFRNPFAFPEPAQCQEGRHSAEVAGEWSAPPPPVSQDLAWEDASMLQRIRRAWRLVRRLAKLAVALAPVAALYPLYRLLHGDGGDGGIGDDGALTDAHAIALRHGRDDDDDDEQLSGFAGWYLRLCLRCVEVSGAAVIKLMQWAGSRPDLFGHDFCAVFGKLQDDTTPHEWRHTAKMMEEAYGPNWTDKIELTEILGSGCIGQVYKGTVKAKATEGGGNDDRHQRRRRQQQQQPVAVKVLHPAVQDDIDADLDLMRLAVRLSQKVPFGVFPSLKWLNLEGVVEEFAHLLKLQVDLRREADNLRRFNANFKNDKCITFPKLVDGFDPTENILVETFCDGVPVIEFCRENRDRQELLTRMCNEAIRAVCQMIFIDNMVHGDLHPGNVYVSPDGQKFILFDVGIVNEYSDDDHQTIVDILAAFIRRQGRIAGRRMIDDSNMRMRRRDGGVDHALEEEQFIDKVEALTIQASTSGYFMEHLGTYITYLCESAAQHHVMLNPSFVTAALAVKLEEGIALAMDPSCKIPKVAIPIIIESERRRFAQSASEKLGWERIKKTIFGVNDRREDHRGKQ